MITFLQQVLASEHAYEYGVNFLSKIRHPLDVLNCVEKDYPMTDQHAHIHVTYLSCNRISVQFGIMAAEFVEHRVYLVPVDNCHNNNLKQVFFINLSTLTE